MRNAIKYYYNIEVEEIKFIDGYYYFDNYVLLEYYKPLDLNIYQFCKDSKIYVHEIVSNLENQYVTFIDDKPYILLKMQRNIHIDLAHIENYIIPFYSKEKVNWAKLWEEKIDYYETFFSRDNNYINEILPYYIGLGENAISLYKSLDINEYLYLSHCRLNKDIDFFNPLNLILDYKVRDIGEYIKEQFFLGQSYSNYLKNYIVVKYLSYNECLLLFCRLLFPSYFFDLCDEYIKGENIDDQLNIYISKTEDYEQFLREIYTFMRTRFQIPRIDWLVIKKI